MKPLRKKRIPKPATPQPALKSRLQALYEDRKEAFWFCGKFLFLMLVYFAVSMTPFFNHFINGYLKLLVGGTSTLLHWIGEPNQLAGDTIWSQKYAVSVLPFCSATEFIWFYCSAIFAFPAKWRQRLMGAIAGALVIVFLNLLRISSLFYAGVHFRDSFDEIHQEVWPAIFILVTICIGGIWLQWVRGKDEEKDT